MSEQIFISYRRDGGDIYAKAICESLKTKGYSVFYDHDSIRRGRFDTKIYTAIEECVDFVLVLPPKGLDPREDEEDWVRIEIEYALKCNKPIIPVLLPGFSFPKKLPESIAVISKIHGINFNMDYYNSFIDTIVNRLTSVLDIPPTPPSDPDNTEAEQDSEQSEQNEEKDPEPIIEPEYEGSEGLEFTLNEDKKSYSVKRGTCIDAEVIIPSSYKGKPVTRIEHSAFHDCYSLKSIEIPDSVTLIASGAFSNCAALTSITLPNRLTNIEEWSFSGCSSLTSVDIPSGVTSIGNSAFSHCKSLVSIIIPDTVNNIGEYAFFFCESLASITIPKNITCIKNDTFSLCESLVSVTMHNNLQSIESDAFYSCSSLQSIDLPDSLTSIGEYAFGRCNLLESVTLPPKVTNIGDNAFCGCTHMTSITMSDSIRSIGSHSFSQCYKLEKIIYTGWTFQWKKVKTGIYWYPDHISMINCSDDYCEIDTNKKLRFELNDEKSEYTLVQGARDTEEIIIPKYYNKKPVTGIGDNAFEDCSLVSIKMSNNIKIIGERAFFLCKSLKSITIPKSVSRIEFSTFNGCYSLVSATMPKSVTSIGRSAFSSCYSLTTITIPKNVTSIESGAFEACESLKTIRFGGTVKQWHNVKLAEDCFPEHITVIRCLDGDYQLK